jgi:hypothetical protein
MQFWILGKKTIQLLHLGFEAGENVVAPTR